MTPAQLLDRALRADASRPLLTWYDDATGDRVELSVATAANWAAKTANLLVEDGVERVRLEPGWHWLAAVVALGAWTAGVVVSADGEPLPADPREFTASVLAQPDAVMAAPADPDAVALVFGSRRWTLAELGEAAVTAAAAHGLAVHARVLSTWSLESVDGLDAGLLLPLAVDGSAVLVANADESRLADRMRTERVDVRLS